MIVFIFEIGAVFGWSLEVIYRRIVDKERRWTNPGFCVGPWLPIYGISILLAFLTTYFNDTSFINDVLLRKIVIFLIIALCITAMEFISGYILLRYYNLRLWDYRNEKFNYKGFICLKYSIYWIFLASIYYFLIHNNIYNSVVWLSHNLIFSFIVGMIFATMLIDVIYSAKVVAIISNFAINNNIIVKFDEIKDRVQNEIRKQKDKTAYFIFLLHENIQKMILTNK